MKRRGATARSIMPSYSGRQGDCTGRNEATRDMRSQDPYRAVAWTPDGQAVLVAHAPEDNKGKALWLVPVNGGSPRRLNIDISTWGTGQGIGLHPNGKQIAFFTGEDAREVWSLENVVPAPLK